MLIQWLADTEDNLLLWWLADTKDGGGLEDGDTEDAEADAC